MKRATLLFVVVLTALLLRSESRIWNRNWEFRRGDAEAWQACHLPHSFSAPYFLGPDFYVGDGWYRKTLRPEETQTENLFLDFEGAFQFVEIWLDGVRVGGHRGGYTGFRVDLTPVLKRERAQEVRVRVSNTWDSCTAPRAGEHIFTGGINRDVHLVSEGSVYIERNGLVVTTPIVSEERAVAEAKVLLRNTSDMARVVTLTGTLGDQPPSSPSEVTVPPKGSAETTLRFLVERPKLWWPAAMAKGAAPHLYALSVEVREAGAVLAKTGAKIGFRWFEFTKDSGFSINGEPFFLLGANVHQDIAGWGDGVTNASHDRDVRMMVEAGFNFIRGSHYPHDPAFLDACDRRGILFWSEGGIWGMGGCKAGDERWNASAVPERPEDREAFAQSAERLVREMIQDARNHPSVIAWSVCNEPFFLAGGDGVQEASKNLVRRLLAVVREEDSTRPAAVGGVQRGGFDRLGADLIGYNGDGARLYRDPPGPSLVAEYGSVISKRPGPYAPGWGDFANDRPVWRSGAAVWCGFDHGSIWESGSRMGIVDFFRLPKRAWYWYRNELRGIPPPAWPQKVKASALRLESDRPSLASCDGTDDALLTVRLTDAAGRTVDDTRSVTLTIAEGPGEFPTGRTITFRPGTDIDLIEGQAAIVFRSNFAGTSRIIAESEGLSPAELFIETSRGTCTDPDPDYVPGISRRTPDRPYVSRYQVSKMTSSVAADLAANRPCRATSNEAGAPAANDGDEASAWTADSSDGTPTWTLDLEFVFPLDRAEVVLPESASVPVLETSQDRRIFVSVGPAVETSVKGGRRTLRFVFPEGHPPAKYVRVRFPEDGAAALSALRLFSGK